MPQQELSPVIIAASIAALMAFISLILQIVFRISDSKDKKKQARLEKRQEALLLALQVIDYVFRNEHFDNNPPFNPCEWDISLAHEAMNKMILYCDNPNQVVSAFAKAIGLDKSEPITPRNLDNFRRIVCVELGLPLTNYVNPNITWIASLAGAKKI
jgi:hypothetical protein